VDPPGRPVGGPEPTVPHRLAVVGEGEAPRPVHERLGVGDAEPGEARWAAEMDERGSGLGAADCLAGRVVADGAGGPLGGELPPGPIRAAPHPNPAIP